MNSKERDMRAFKQNTHDIDPDTWENYICDFEKEVAE